MRWEWTGSWGCTVGAVVLALACSPDESSTQAATGPGGAGGTGSICEPGKQIECACPGGSEGAQRCRDDGAGWEQCLCPDAGSGGTSGTAGAAGQDAGSGGTSGTAGAAGSAGTGGTAGTAGHDAGPDAHPDDAGPDGAVDPCAVVPDDGYESNDTCSDGYELPPAEEDASAVVIQDATLHHQDSGPDTDWYFIVAQPGNHFCFPGEKLCYFAFRVALTPPATADHAVYRMCVSSGVCGSAGETCTTAADWNGTRYDLVLQSQMSCGFILERLSVGWKVATMAEPSEDV